MFANIALSASSNPDAYGSVGQSAIYAVLGYLVVFIGLVLLMAVIVGLGKIMVARQPAEPAPAPKPAPAPVKAAEPVKTGPVAPGSAGEVMLGEVPEREAALIMAIVADKMGKPLNELRFKSIKEVK